MQEITEQMILNHGNIRNSKVLFRHFIDDLSEEEISQRISDYRHTLEQEEFSDYRRIEAHVHDARLEIRQTPTTVEFDLKFFDEGLHIGRRAKMIFQKGEILSWNKVLKSGRITRLNRAIQPYQYAYDEFYEHQGRKYASIVVFTGPFNKVNTGIYFPMLTIRYETLTVETIADQDGAPSQGRA